MVSYVFHVVSVIWFYVIFYLISGVFIWLLCGFHVMLCVFYMVSCGFMWFYVASCGFYVVS